MFSVHDANGRCLLAPPSVTAELNTIRSISWSIPSQPKKSVVRESHELGMRREDPLNQCESPHPKRSRNLPVSISTNAALSSMRHPCISCSLILLLVAASAMPIASAQWKPNGLPVCDTTANSGFSMLPKVAEDGHGGAFVCWHDSRNADIYLQHIGHDGRMLLPKNGVPLIDDSSSQQYPRIVADGEGGAFLAWEDGRGDNLYPYAQHIDGSGLRMWAAGGVKVSDRSGLFISIRPSEGGSLLVAWNGGGGPDVLVQKLDRSGVRCWGDSGVFLSRGQGDVAANDVLVETDMSGGAIVVWSKDGVIRCQRVDSLGNVRWGETGIRLSDSTGNISVGISSDGSGGALFSWGDLELTEMVAQRVRANGDIAWNSGGVTLGGIAMGGARRHSPDGHGGAFVGHSRWIQHLDTTGALLWPAPGATFTQAPNNFVNSSQVVNGSDGVWNFFGQVVELENATDIYAQYIGINGSVRWGSIGLSVCSHVRTQDWPQGVHAGMGRALLVWDDFRDMHSNVYAALVDTLGVVTSVVLAEESPVGNLLLYQNFPNPFNPGTTVTYVLPQPGKVTVEVIDLLGRRAATLVNAFQDSGMHSVTLDGSKLSAGVYFCRVHFNNLIRTAKMVLLR